jgi:hypothetical protein
MGVLPQSGREMLRLFFESLKKRLGNAQMLPAFINQARMCRVLGG